MKKITIGLTIATLLLVINVLAAKADEDFGIQNQTHTRENNSLEIHNQDNENEFKVSGEISAVADDSSNFTVNEQIIYVDPAKVGEFKQKGILAVGQNVKVEGVIIDSKMYAEDINVIGTGQGRFKIEIENGESSSPSPLPSGSPTATATPTTLGGQIQVKAVGTMEQIIAFLKQILNFFNSSN